MSSHNAHFSVMLWFEPFRWLFWNLLCINITNPWVKLQVLRNFLVRQLYNGRYQTQSWAQMFEEYPTYPTIYCSHRSRTSTLEAGRCLKSMIYPLWASVTITKIHLRYVSIHHISKFYVRTILQLSHLWYSDIIILSREYC